MIEGWSGVVFVKQWAAPRCRLLFLDEMEILLKLTECACLDKDFSFL